VKPTRRYTPTKIRPDSRHSKGSEPSRLESSDPMREADEPSTGRVVTELSEVCSPHRGQSSSHHPRSRATQRGRNAKAAPRGHPKSAAKDSIKAGGRKPRPDWPGSPARSGARNLPSTVRGRVHNIRTASVRVRGLRRSGWGQAYSLPAPLRSIPMLYASGSWADTITSQSRSTFARIFSSSLKTVSRPASGWIRTITGRQL
jgi:hypothetical protein